MRTVPGLLAPDDGRPRCWWAWADRSPLYLEYHDDEWGRPVVDDRRLFEKLCLEGFQAGLSWLTILKKRENFRRAFRGFNPAKVARFDRRSVDRLLGDAGIVRHRGKIEAAIHNARRALEMIEAHGSLAAWVWRFEPPAKERPKRLTKRALLGMTETPTSRAMSRELKRLGWRYVGPRTAYAFLQAMGLVNDHVEGCAVRTDAEAARRRCRRPGCAAVVRGRACGRVSRFDRPGEIP